MPQRVAMGTNEAGQPTRYIWNEQASMAQLPSYSVAYQTNDLNLNAEQVDKLALSMAHTFEKAIPAVCSVVLIFALLVHFAITDIPTPALVVMTLLVLLFVLFIPRVIEWYYKTMLIDKMISRYDGTTTSVIRQHEAATPAAEEISYPTKARINPFEELEIVLRYVLKRCYLVTCSSPRPEQKPYAVVPLINKQLTPQLHRKAIVILQDFGLITRSAERQKREVVLATEAEAQAKLTQLLPRLKTLDLDSVEQRAKFEQDST